MYARDSGSLAEGLGALPQRPLRGNAAHASPQRVPGVPGGELLSERLERGLKRGLLLGASVLGKAFALGQGNLCALSPLALKVAAEALVSRLAVAQGIRATIERATRTRLLGTAVAKEGKGSVARGSSDAGARHQFLTR